MWLFSIKVALIILFSKGVLFPSHPGLLKILGCLLVAFPAKYFTGDDGIPAVTKTMVHPPTAREWFVLPIPDQWPITPDIRVVVV